MGSIKLSEGTNQKANIEHVMTSSFTDPTEVSAMNLQDDEDPGLRNQANVPQSLQSTRRSLDSSNDVSRTTMSGDSQRDLKHAHKSKKRYQDHQRKRDRLQDDMYDSTKEEVKRNPNGETLTEDLDKMGLAKKVGQKTGSTPRSSGRFDWFFKDSLRKAKKKLQRGKMRRTQGESEAPGNVSDEELTADVRNHEMADVSEGKDDKEGRRHSR